ncbi:MAG: hypothetical protein RL186_1351 [Pseudomonadota bacterium]
MSEPVLRLSVSLGLLTLFVILEHWRPARANVLDGVRIGRHSLFALQGVTVSRFALGGGLAGLALVAQDHKWGLFHQFEIPPALAFGLSVILLDLALWFQHRLMHEVPLLWRLHRMHHSDIAMDVSTAYRFHPFEILVSLAYKAALVVALGAPASAVIAFEIALAAGALFTHANIAISPKWEARLRTLLVTPALHLIHHSPDPIETNSNYGFSVNIWDRLFGTFRANRLVPDGPIGLAEWRAPDDQTLAALSRNPFEAA